MSNNKIVEVLCLNGRRQKIKTNSSSTVLQVLKEACQKHGFSDADIDLIHKRKVLDVTATIGYSNIPNNGKLEMVKRNIPRKASQVHVALQTEFSDRLQHAFEPTCSLFDVLRHWDGEPGSPYNGKLICRTPVIVYMTRQISGIHSLRTTTLERLGLISGRAAMRLTHKEEEDTSIQEDIEISDAQPVRSNSTHTGDEASTDLKLDSRNSSALQVTDDASESCPSSEPVQAKAPALLTSDYPTETKEDKEPTEKKLRLSDKTSLERPKQQSPYQAVAAASSQGTIAVPPRLHNDFKFPDVQNQQNEFIQKIEPVDPKKILTEMKLSMPCKRNPIIFKCDRDESMKTAEYEEPPDQFFEVTVNEMRKLLMDQSLKSEEENILMTKAMREAKEAEKISQYKQVMIRILFPDKMALQGIFRPLEPVSVVKEFVREHLEDKNAKFDLYTTPPRCILKNLKQDLYSAKLVPSAVVRVSGETKSNGWLRRELIESPSTYVQAEIIANNTLKRCDGTISSTENILSNVHNEAEQESSASHAASTPAVKASTSHKESGGKVPKWFKQGKK